MATTMVNGAQSERRPSPSRFRLKVPGPPGGRRNRTALLTGLVLVVVCGLGTAALYASAGHRSEVLVMARDVAPGARVTNADLGVAEVAASSSLTPVPVSLRSRVVGRLARVGLVKGSLLTPAQLAKGDTIGGGQAVVALLLKFGQAPNLSPGDRVSVVAPTENLNAAAQVFAVDHQANSTDVRVSVLTDENTAARIASVVANRAEITVVLRSSGS